MTRVDGDGERSTLTYLPPGVRVMRVGAVIAAIAAVLFTLLGVWIALEGSWIGWLYVAVGFLQAALFAAQAWFAWARPATTRVDGDGVSVRVASLTLRTFAWDQIAGVVPAASGRPQSSLLLRDGTSLTLPGMTPEDATWLAGLVSDTHRGADGRFSEQNER